MATTRTCSAHSDACRTTRVEFDMLANNLVKVIVPLLIEDRAVHSDDVQAAELAYQNTVVVAHRVRWVR